MSLLGGCLNKAGIRLIACGIILLLLFSKAGKESAIGAVNQMTDIRVGQAARYG
ncbi:MAG: hypothetical protein K2O03_11035 [Lachnospiraceae bacterium]|nr:hypothetical protein [Lachnospiraceae bacterium]